jgi:uncharacterized protein with ATP-grasp and redox domains
VNRYYAHFEPHFDQFLDRTHAHLTARHNYDWMHASGDRFHWVPDYLRLSQFASTPAKQHLNRLLAHAPLLWRYTAWPRIQTAVWTVFSTKYVPLLWANNPHEAETILRDIYAAFDALFRGSDTAHLRHATFTDLYYFLNELLKTISTVHGLPLDPYSDLKTQQDRHCMGYYRQVRTEILGHKRGFEMACYLTIRANWIDCVEDHVERFLFQLGDDISQILDNLEVLDTQIAFNPFFQLNRLKQLLAQKPSQILYELDNHGEVVWDLLVIELLITAGHRVVIAAKDEPVLNDVTHLELSELLALDTFSHLQVYLTDGRLSILNTASKIAGKYLPFVSEAYKSIFTTVDLLILKGQGNFQTMPMGQTVNGQFVPYLYAKPIVYMMSIKAPFILACLQSVFRARTPILGTPFLYVYDSQRKATYPR